MELKFLLYLTEQLETDIQILLEKVDMALKKYKMHKVVANEFLTCKGEVVVVTSNEKISKKSKKYSV
ncbi:phosphopantothenate--cysteine ligase 1 [Quercus suber]|uniref:Phosphopantothenate--cysteine ligase 1 n=1 Tax=Quercus suber TaxID=58331 RepID=A0AAW0M5U0_QUESU